MTFHERTSQLRWSKRSNGKFTVPTYVIGARTNMQRYYLFCISIPL